MNLNILKDVVHLNNFLNLGSSNSQLTFYFGFYTPQDFEKLA